MHLINITHLTTVSIFFLYLGSILHRYSGLINIAAKLKAEFFNPARWHSITAEVKIGTMSVAEWNNDVKYLFTNINVKNLWANTAKKVLVKKDYFSSFPWYTVAQFRPFVEPYTRKPWFHLSLPHTPEAQHGSRNVLIVAMSPKSGLHSLKPTF